MNTHPRGRVYSSIGSNAYYAIDDGSKTYPYLPNVTTCSGPSFANFCGSIESEEIRLTDSVPMGYMQYLGWGSGYYFGGGGFQRIGSAGSLSDLRTGQGPETNDPIPLGPGGRRGGFVVQKYDGYFLRRVFPYFTQTVPQNVSPNNVVITRNEYCSLGGSPVVLTCDFPITRVQFYYCNIGFRLGNVYFADEDPEVLPPALDRELPCRELSPTGTVAEKTSHQLKGGPSVIVRNGGASGPGGSCEGNPCIPNTGEKVVFETDFTFGSHPFTRTYRSGRKVKAYSFYDENWHHSWSSRVLTNDLSRNLPTFNRFVQSAAGEIEPFEPVAGSPGTFRHPRKAGQFLREFTSGPVKFQLTLGNGAYENYDDSGRLIEKGNRSDPSQRLTFTYLLSPGKVDWAWWALERVTDARGRVLKFSYNLNLTYQPRLTQIGIEEGSTVQPLVTYAYWGETDVFDVHWRLKQASYPDNRVRRYVYGDTEPGNTGNQSLRTHLTGILLGTTTLADNLFQRFATYRYDATGRVTESYRGGDTLQAGRVQLSYVGNSDTDASSVEVTQALGDKRTYQLPALGLSEQLNPFHVPTAVGESSAGLQTVSTTTVYNAQEPSNCSNLSDWRPCRVKDRRGFVTRYFYSGAFLVRIEEGLLDSPGFPATAVARTITMGWDTGTGQMTERRVCAGKVACSSDAWPVLRELSRYTYDSNGKQLATCEYDASVSGATSYVCGNSNNADPGVRQTRYSYCAAGTPGCSTASLGWLRSIDGPRTDVSDITNWSYHTTTVTSGCAGSSGLCYREGDLASVSSALGHTTSFPRYDNRGRNTRSVDANGTITDIVFDSEGRVLQRIVRANTDGTPSAAGDATISMEYEIYGELKRTIQADGVGQEYCRDAAHRITAIVPTVLSSGTRCVGAQPVTGHDAIVYTLDAAGNRIKEETRDTSGNVKRLLARQYNARGQLRSTINAPYASASNLDDVSVKKTTYTYDQNSNLDLTTDPLGRVSDNDYDPLNRLMQSIQDKGPGAINATVSYEYDARDNLRKVIDPKTLDTEYVFDGLNNQTLLDSPDTGVSSFTYDAAGNRLTQTDARLVVSNYAYDAQNRLISVIYPSDTSKNVAYFYDTVETVCASDEQFAVGHQTKMTDASGQTQFCYDRRGNLKRKVQTTPGSVLTTTYTYDVADRLATMTYPSGLVVTYARSQALDIYGRITSVSVSRGSFSLPLLSGVAYEPYGPVKQLNFGNGETLNKAWDQNYWPDAVSSAAISHDFTTNDVGNIVTLTGGGGAQTMSYDGLDRLSQATRGAPLFESESWQYDPTGNRLSHLVGAGVVTNDEYSYDPNSHRLTKIDGPEGASLRAYDANGNTLSGHLGSESAVYGVDNRLREFVAEDKGAGVNRRWHYNGRGERVATQIVTGTIAGSPYEFFVYDSSGQIASIVYPEWGQGSVAVKTTGEPTRFEEIIWLDNTPVARVFSTAASVLSAHAIHSDHLNTPRALSNLQLQGGQPSGTVVWRWNLNQFDANGSNTFGAQGDDTNPDGNAVHTSFRLRFPGQLHDQASGLHYNYFRNYEPSTGRYVESDPIGLWADTTTYAYGTGNPNTFFDPSGESPAKAVTAALAVALLRCAGNRYCRCVAVYAAYNTICKVPCTGTTCKVLIAQLSAAGTCVALRHAYIKMNCDVLMPGPKNHPGQLEEATNKLVRCAKKTMHECSCRPM